MTEEEFSKFDSRSTGKLKLAHELTYKEIIESEVAVMTPGGHMIGGPDRRFEDQGVTFRAWQKVIQAASKNLGVVPPHVQDYFQQTKHLTKPPASGDLAINRDRPINPSLIIEEALLTKQFVPPRFTWSWSQYSSFLTCPAKWMAEKYFKTIPYVESEAMRMGNMIHATAEHYVKSKIGQQFKQSEIRSQYLPQVQKYCDTLVAAHNAGAQVHIEKEMCVTNQFKQCGWWDNDIVWYRGKADVLVLKDTKLVVWDYKSGAVKPEFMQLKMMCAFGALFFPEAELFDGKLIFTKHGEIKGLDKPMTRAELKPILQEVIANVRRMEDCWAQGEGQARKNGLCRSYCGNKACAHCGGY